MRAAEPIARLASLGVVALNLKCQVIKLRRICDELFFLEIDVF